MALLELHGTHGEGKFAIVDHEDLKRLREFRWLVSSNGYVYRNIKVNGHTIGLHHEVLGISDPNYSNPVDHDNRNKLDNRKENLVRTTPTNNLLNRPLYRNSPTGVKFVYKKPRKSGMRFVVMISGCSQRTFTSIEDATKFVSSNKDR